VLEREAEAPLSAVAVTWTAAAGALSVALEPIAARVVTNPLMIACGFESVPPKSPAPRAPAVDETRVLEFASTWRPVPPKRSAPQSLVVDESVRAVGSEILPAMMPPSTVSVLEVTELFEVVDIEAAPDVVTDSVPTVADVLARAVADVLARAVSCAATKVPVAANAPIPRLESVAEMVLVPITVMAKLLEAVIVPSSSADTAESIFAEAR